MQKIEHNVQFFGYHQLSADKETNCFRLLLLLIYHMLHFTSYLSRCCTEGRVKCGGSGCSSLSLPLTVDDVRPETKKIAQPQSRQIGS